MKSDSDTKPFCRQWWATVILILVSITFWPFTVGGYAFYKTLKSKKLIEELKLILMAIIAIFTLSIGNVWSSLLFSDLVNQTEKENTATSNTEKEVGSDIEAYNEPDREDKIQTSIKVIRIVDGDTIELSTGEKVRYIGINTPKIKQNSKDVDECYGKEASAKNSELVLDKEIKLEKDVSEMDRYGRLLRYVYVNNIFVNDYLVRQGYANSSSYPPDVKHQEQFMEAEREARENQRGLWGSICIKSPTPTLVVQPKQVVKPTQPLVPQVQTTNFTCDCGKYCSQMDSCEEAYYQLNQCGCNRRDGDNDGIPCESICN